MVGLLPLPQKAPRLESVRTSRRLPALFAAVAALVAGAVLATAGPAAAHDELLSSDPAAGAVVTELPGELVLTFSAELLGDGAGNEVQVTDAAGTVLSDGPAVAAGTSLTQPLAGEAAGEIRVLWRAVSSDGHPISGEFAFTVHAPAPEPSATADDPETVAPTQAPTASETPEGTMTTMSEPGEDAAGIPVWVWVVLGVVGAGVVGAVVYVLAARGRDDRRRPDAPADR